MINKLQKYKRIQRLHELGFNTPWMLVIHKGKDSPNNFADAYNFLSDNKIANMRTYRLVGENWGNPHFFQRPNWEIVENLPKLVNKGYVCMIESFNPNYTTYNGSFVIFSSEQKWWKMDFCIGRKKTVRMVDKFIEGDYDDLYGTKLPRELREPLDIGISLFPNKPVILEWSWSERPQGRLKENVIFWEYRNPNKPYGG